jgi:pyruvate dehydrogenase E2 component (dihydrolipoamide acetyltransferase)
MSIEIKVPDIGDFSEVPVVSILVSVGDTIAEEDPIVELESDKATMEVPASHGGVIREIKVSEGDNVSEGAVLLIVEADGAAAAPAAEAAAPTPAAAPAPVTDAGFSKAHASPSVRAFARRVEIDLAQVNGTGRKGRILREDIEAALKAKAAPAPSTAGAPAGGMGIPPIPAVDFSKFGPVEDVEMSRIKKISGPALHRAWLNIPHVTHNDEADITELDAYRKEMDTMAKEQGYRVTLLSFVVKASVSALKTHWEFNSSIHPDGDKLIKKNFYNIGFAADTPNGLVVPVIKDADKKGLVEISKDLMDLSAKARAGELKGPDMSGATFTISSLGGIGGTHFTPIVNAPEVAILGLTRSKMAPVWNPQTETFEPRLMQPLSLSYDHRAVDGALAARFCVTLKTLLGDMRKLMW